jgi:Bacterial low temperature requirement A protein (LtrA)
MPDPEREPARGDEHEVTPLELFFDLVFVFAITQVTKLLTSEPTWGGLLRGMLVLAAVWWAWTTYAWLTSAIDVDEGAVRLTMLASTAIMLGVALAVPRAFGADGDVDAPVGVSSCSPSTEGCSSLFGIAALLAFVAFSSVAIALPQSSRIVRSTRRSRSGSARKSSSTILPFRTVTAAIENGCPWRKATVPATPLISTGRMSSPIRA